MEQSTIDINDSGEIIKNNFLLQEDLDAESNKGLYTLILIVILLVIIIRKFCK